MAKKERPPEEPVDDVPTWIITYSDVITLLMTFFILLLTFATSEPEKFEKMQVSMFGGAGATGIAGPSDGTMEKDSIVMRERPRSSRMSSKGSQTPPTHSDPATKSLAKGLEGLDKSLDVDTQSSVAFEFPLSLFVTRENTISNIGRQYLRMFARRLKKGPFALSLELRDEADLPSVLQISQHLINSEGIPPFKIRVGVASGDDAPNFRVVLTQASES